MTDLNNRTTDTDRVLAHLQAQNYRAERLAGPLWDMPSDRWGAAIDALQASGYQINTSTLTSGDVACNETGYWIAAEPSPTAHAEEHAR